MISNIWSRHSTNTCVCYSSSLEIIIVQYRNKVQSWQVVYDSTSSTGEKPFPKDRATLTLTLLNTERTTKLSKAWELIE